MHKCARKTVLRGLGRLPFAMAGQAPVSEETRTRW
jgi:hypothetical protein